MGGIWSAVLSKGVSREGDANSNCSAFRQALQPLFVAVREVQARYYLRILLCSKSKLTLRLLQHLLILV